MLDLDSLDKSWLLWFCIILYILLT